MPKVDTAAIKSHRVFTKLFGSPEEINGANRCPTYLYRWFVMRTRWFKVYLHHFVADDWSLDLHDHPKRFISIGLKGGYRETTPAGWKDYHSPWLRTFPAEHIHRLKMFRAREGGPGYIHCRPSVFALIAALVVGSHKRTDLCGVVGMPEVLKPCWTLVIVLRGTREWGFWHLGRFIPWKSYVNGPDSKIADEMKACGDL